MCGGIRLHPCQNYSWQVPKILGFGSFVAAVVVNKIISMTIEVLIKLYLQHSAEMAADGQTALLDAYDFFRVS